jgi:DNA mismatch endonuclease Vsr
MHPANIIGKPDFVISATRTAIFCDGDFWHGRDWQKRRAKLLAGANASYWCAKIRRNMLRDKKVSAQLIDDGWAVLRFWESDIRRAPEAVIEAIVEQQKIRAEA